MPDFTNTDSILLFFKKQFVSNSLIVPGHRLSIVTGLQLKVHGDKHVLVTFAAECGMLTEHCIHLVGRFRALISRISAENYISVP